MKNTQQIQVRDTKINITKVDNKDYISLTDMVKGFEDGVALIEKWLRNKNTIEFIGIWEQLNNPDFNSPEFEGIKNEAGLNRFTLSVKKWVTKTHAIGLFAKTGRYASGTYAHVDIAFEFGSWLSPEFKLYLIKEFQRLKEEEQRMLSNQWNLHRTLAKVNYTIHTDAIKENLVPPRLTKRQASFVYASEADLLNKALFGHTAKEWREVNPYKSGNVRDHSTMEQLLVLANMESMNAEYIRMGLPPEERIVKLNEMARQQMKSLLRYEGVKKLNN